MFSTLSYLKITFSASVRPRFTAQIRQVSSGGVWLAQVGGLLLLVTDVVAVESDWGDPIELDHLTAATATAIARAVVCGTAELGDRDGLALRDQCADALLIDVGDLLRAVGIDRDDVERCPVNDLKRDGGVGDLAAEPLADHGNGPGEEVVDAGGQHGQHLERLWLSPQEIAHPPLEAVAGQEPAIE
ncbi:MAG: hypothetical protein J2P37_33540, partial [Ktedonobacteraceae bacterium]|nr:hypothetical protein [Ktedonobacteraceae bacterium]